MPTARLIAQMLKMYGPGVLLLFGLPGNILSYVVMNQAQFRHTTTSYFIRVLAVCDNGYLITRCFQRFLLASFLRPVLIEWNVLRVFCNEYLSMTRFTQATSRYVLVLMTYDRLLALLFPLQARAYGVMKVAKILTVIVLLLSFLEGFTYLFAKYSKIFSHWLCPYYLPGSLGEVYSQYGTITTFLACGLLIVANVLIAWSLYSHAQRMKALQEDHGNHSKIDELQQRSVKNRQISLMLLLVSSFFLLSNFPREFNVQFWPRHPYSARQYADLRKMTLEISIFVEALNYAINFYLYVASCQKFRMTLKRKFLPGVDKKTKTSVTYTTDRD